MLNLRRLLKHCLLLALAVPMAAVPVPIRLDLEEDRTLEGGQNCTVSAQHPDGQPRTWRWSVRQGTGASLEPAGPDSARFTAPMLVEDEVFSIHVEDAANPADFGDLTFKVIPTYLFRQVVPAIQNSRLWWGARLVPFAGEYPMEGKEPKAGSRHFALLGEVHWIDDPGMGKFNHGFLALDLRGIQFVNIQGEVQPLLGSTDSPVYNALVEATGEQFWEIEMTCLAVRPPGYRGPAGPHVVFACTATVYGSRDKKYSLLFELRPDGTPRVLSSGKLPLSRFLPPPAEARLEQTSFGRISSMAMDPDGALFVAEHGPLGPTIFRIGPDGSVRLWCEGHYVPEPGDAFPDMLCREVTAMALDPVAGVIYAVAGRDLLRLEPINRPGRARGKATTLLRGPKPTHEPPGPSATAARDARLLYRPKGVLFRQGRLFIADEGGNNVWVYDLRTRLLSNLVGDPSQALVRFGTVALAEPEGTAPGLCAALAEPRSLCPGPGDSLMIALPGSMVMIPGGLRLEAGENARARLAAQAAPAAPAP